MTRFSQLMFFHLVIWVSSPSCGSALPGQKNYTLVNIRMTWEDARSYCRQHYTDLAMIEDETEDSAVSSLYPGAHVWIGLYREPWRWSDGSHSNFTNWQSTSPDSYGQNQHCTREQTTYLWNDVPCIDKLPFICHRGSHDPQCQRQLTI
uniref:C-type lectin domain-containing protein n=1 Tax=Periophthalmus magnuspinnatus TaxID=409849 RepID=A0A3B3ZFS9_9GOBI